VHSLGAFKIKHAIINWRDVQTMIVANNVYRYVMFKGTMTKWPVQKLAQGTTQKLLQHHDATDI